MTSRQRRAVLTLVCVVAACDSPAAPVVDEEPVVAARPASPTLGHLAFIAECASCHASRDGFDLAFFSFPDSTIIRRALGHVDTVTAFDIAAYINTLPVAPVGRFDQSFQPGGVQLAGDVEFATNLFGSDAWPSTLTSAQLLAIDPTQIPVALAFPRWSFEENNLDWMPDAPYPEGLLAHSEHRAGDALKKYRASGDGYDLYAATMALRVAERNVMSTEAPCLVSDPARFKPDACFQARRWTASLVGQHMLRSGSSEPMHFSLHDAWWDVGNAARHSLVERMPIENADENWAVWMYLGWAFAPQRHASTYLSSGLTRLGLPRHATFHALRAQVARVEATGDPYQDLRTATMRAPRTWLSDVAAFSLRNLIERLESGDLPSATPFRNVKAGQPESQLDKAWQGLLRGRIQLIARLEREELDALEPLYTRVLELLPPL